MADKIMIIKDNESRQQPFFKPVVSSIQQKCAHCEMEEKQAQRKESNSEAITASSQIEDYVNSLSGGKALSKNEKNFFEIPS